ncbi:hypothetical protein LQR33_14155 [Chromobacterium piscinae]|uniref:hypothetical protein n=2 Tax=Chromobacterium piscinae TaxID=686831 RepID=UPI001E33E21D|nr:hypothetical protein [Chromobacterium piscinae]MCD5328925.1 hypothetical protein [Chromobacterium piscinae]
MMNQMLADQLSSADALKHTREGGELFCPVCRAKLRTIPENWKRGAVLRGIECPVSQKHFFILGEDAGAMKEMRARMRERAGKA